MTPPHSGLLDLEGRTIVLTGASSGIGRACATELAAHGARLVMIGRNAEALAETSARLSGAGHESMVLDLQQVAAIGPAIRKAAASGPFYGLCHAAGIADTMPLTGTSPEQIERMMRVNVVAGIELARTITRRDVMTSDGGSLVFLSSVYASAGAPGETAYCATKGAVSAAVRAMAIELARRRVRVNAISPGLVRTHMTDTAFAELTAAQIAAIEQKHPLGVGTPADVARAALFLLSPAAAWITGVDMPVDGGYSAH